MAAPYPLGQIPPISLNLYQLPKYASFTFIRMFIAMFFSLLFTFIFATWAAKSKRASQYHYPFCRCFTIDPHF